MIAWPPGAEWTRRVNGTTVRVILGALRYVAIVDASGQTVTHDSAAEAMAVGERLALNG